MIYNLYCSKDRNYAHHSVLDDKEDKVQTTKCLICGHEQQRVILGRHVAIEKCLYEEYKKHAEQ